MSGLGSRGGGQEDTLLKKLLYGFLELLPGQFHFITGKLKHSRNRGLSVAEGENQLGRWIQGDDLAGRLLEQDAPIGHGLVVEFLVQGRLDRLFNGHRERVKGEDPSLEKKKGVHDGRFQTSYRVGAPHEMVTWKALRSPWADR